MSVPSLPGSIRWDERGTPHSVLFDDQYFCKDNGYEEGIHVCCHGNQLPERWAALDPQSAGTFTIMETGFGTGLDFCCAWELWDRLAPASWTLHFCSVELYPVPVDDMVKALDLWPSLLPYKNALCSIYAPVPGGVQEIVLGNGRVHLTLVFKDVVEGLGDLARRATLEGSADAWFLDGFAPSKNPRMWADEVYAAMAHLSKPGTTCATFTVAGAVRRGLGAHGFGVRKVPGHGKKRQVLAGVFKGAF